MYFCIMVLILSYTFLYKFPKQTSFSLSSFSSDFHSAGTNGKSSEDHSGYTKESQPMS